MKCTVLNVVLILPRNRIVLSVTRLRPSERSDFHFTLAHTHAGPNHRSATEPKPTDDRRHKIQPNATQPMDGPNPCPSL